MKTNKILLLKDRILAVYQKATERHEEDSPGAILRDYLNFNFEGTPEERAQELASYGESFGNGSLGGINVYEHNDGATFVEWTLSDISTWITLGNILDAAESNVWDLAPSWFDDEWIQVSDGLGNWISKRMYEEKKAQQNRHYQYSD